MERRREGKRTERGSIERESEKRIGGEENVKGK